MNDCQCHCDPTSDGTAQLGRYLAALDPSYAPIDGRSFEDLLVFAKRYADQVRFYDVPGSTIPEVSDPVHESRRLFFRSNPAIVDAAKTIKNIKERKTDFEALRESLETYPSRDSFLEVCNAVVSMLGAADTWYSAIVKNDPVHAGLDQQIAAAIKGYTSKVPGYEAGYNTIDEAHPLGLDFSKIANKSVWGIGGTVIPDDSIYQGPLYEDKIRYAGVHFEDVFYAIYEFLTDAVAAAHGDEVSWAEFFRRDIAVVAASIATTTPATIRAEYDERRELVEADPIQQNFGVLFDPILKMVVQIDHWYSQSIPGHPLHNDLSLAIDSYLGTQFRRAISYAEAYRYVDAKHSISIDITRVVNQELWGLEQTIDPDASVYVGENLEDMIRSAALFVDDVFNTIFAFLDKTVEERAVVYLQKALEEFPGHQPHVTLFIAFLELFRIAQDQLNGLTQRMLDYYYADILQLDRKPAEPDHAFVVFELAQSAAGPFDLPAGTLLKAGKDASGHDLTYQTQSDLVVHAAKVKELKSVFIQKTVDAAANPGKVIGVYARPVANSGDGIGGDFTDPSKKWPTFGTGAPVVASRSNICDYIEAEKQQLHPVKTTGIGFAVASPHLYLQGGNRIIGWRVPGLSKILTDPTKPATIRLTGEKGWISVLSNSGQNVVAAMRAALDQGDFSKLGAIDTSACVVIDPAANLEEILVYLPVAEKGIIQFDKKIHTGSSYSTTSPVMELSIDSLNVLVSDYIMSEIATQSVEVRVGSISTTQDAAGNTVPALNFDGLRTLVLQNEAMVFAPGKPFDPYTAYPSLGKSFYIGTNEVFSKSLGELSINIKKTKDGDVVPDLSNDKWGSTISILDGRQWKSLMTDVGQSYSRTQLAGNVLTPIVSSPPEFNSELMMKKAATLPSSGGDATKATTTLFRSLIEPITQYDLSKTKGFIRVTNTLEPSTNDRGSVMQSAQDLAPDLQISDVSLSYYASIDRLKPGVDQYFHIYPFGVAEVLLEGAVTSAPSLALNAGQKLLPQFTFTDGTSTRATTTGSEYIGDTIRKRVDVTCSGKTANDLALGKLLYESSGLRAAREGGFNQYSGSIEQEGSLYIGIEKLNPLDSIALLFQFAEGSATDEDDDPPQIRWSYLIGNEWRPLPQEHLISDSTYGFQTTGIVKIDVPGDANTHHTMITDGLLWFCASVEDHTDRIPMLVDIVAQAVETQLASVTGIDQAHFDTALPAGTISALTIKRAEISSVTQPFASFDGKHREVGAEYYRRVSERLRHKGRAVTAKDYELLVLEAFPSIYKVKCLTTSDPNCFCRESDPNNTSHQHDCCGPQVAPGHVTLIPIADLKHRNGTNPLQPKTSRLTLLEIEDYLSARTSPFVSVYAKNPVYEQVLCYFRVQFVSGADTGYYLATLNNELIKFLTPWAFSEDADVSFGQKIYASTVIRFIESRDYVDFIDDFLMFVCKDCCCPTQPAIATKDTPATAPTFPEQLAAALDCCDLETLFEAAPNLLGETVVSPSTPRSILVSANKHIILPYEVPPNLTPCEKRAAQSVLGTANQMTPGGGEVSPMAPSQEAAIAVVATQQVSRAGSTVAKEIVAAKKQPATSASKTTKVSSRTSGKK
ncbi:MAG: baseplate J/gp47 family protein [Bacteroidetes bacterium]|nr:baseplate J/gp47 family protein [Bacteroidota bacterium]